MVVENKEERLARGHPVGQDVPYAAMGGLTGFSSLADAYLRLDDSGVGKNVCSYRFGMDSGGVEAGGGYWCVYKSSKQFCQSIN